jgi:Mn-containing catalase
VQETLRFLMTREIAHFQMFGAALDTIQPNFPPGVLQGDPHYTHTFFNMSNGPSGDGPWNHGRGPWLEGESWQFIDDPVQHVISTHGLIDEPIRGTTRDENSVRSMNKQLSKQRSREITSAVPSGENQWSSYPQDRLESPTRAQ